MRPFQRAVAASSASVTFVRAGCGSGKTLAAYAWAAKNHGGRQLWMLYPTTGTTTEGYRDYLLAAEPGARLEHSRREVDLEAFETPDATIEGDRLRDRLDALRSWGAPIVAATVDTVLGLMQNQRKGLYAWAGLSHSSVVFDEIHAYDDKLFGLLLRFIEALPGVPTLLMTASLPRVRLEALSRTVARVHGASMQIVEGPPDLECLPRYRRIDATDLSETIRRALANGNKVLQVSNTVDRAMRAVQAVSHGVVYHSHFRYVDRVSRHNEVINAFRGRDAVFASTTQVAEMSLDISADLLVTDLAPVPALIQRLGRLNRRATPERPGEIKSFIVVDVEQPLPYEPVNLDSARAWLERLGGGPLSQRDLVAAWCDDPVSELPATESAWLDGGLRTGILATREASPGITVVLARDRNRVEKGQLSPIEAALPMGVPRGAAWRTWPRVRGYFVCPEDAIEYDETRGGRWRKQ
jgi:CRISPR-associated endonuclease/helicase Cas3